MTTAQQTCAQLSKEILRAVDKAEQALNNKGICPGATVSHWRGTFKVTRVETNFYPNYRSVSVTLYGHKLLKDNTFGEHEHYIARADEVTLF